MDRAGFTLLEMMVVLAILGLTVTLVMPSIRKSGTVSADATAHTLAAALEKTRSRAILGNQETRHVIDAKQRAEGGLKVTLNVAATEVEGTARGGIRFYPDGSSSGGTIAFDDGRSTFTVAVDWLTGGIDVRGR